MHSVARLAFRFTKPPNWTRTVHGGFQVGCGDFANSCHPWGGGGGGGQPGILCILAPHGIQSLAAINALLLKLCSIPQNHPMVCLEADSNAFWSIDNIYTNHPIGWGSNFLSKKCSLENFNKYQVHSCFSVRLKLPFYNRFLAN